MQHQVETKPTHQRVSLDDLSALSFRELESLYRKGTVPPSLAAVNGSPQGRMLAVRRLDRGVVGALLRRVAASPAFVWAGKSFEAETATNGSGINRLQAPSVIGRQSLFPFATRFDASAIDGNRTIVLDYDRPENPPYIRRIHDEIREVSPGVFLGPAMWKTSRGATTLLWFSLDTGRR
jgi:hypothetical protein